MGGRLQFLSSWLLGTVLACSIIGVGCARQDRVYDAEHGDYHVWNRDENTFYNQWAVENHRDPHRDFRRLPPDEQKQYWAWRHNH